MATYIRKLKSSDGNFICPASRSKAIYLDDDRDLQTWIESVNTNISSLNSSIDSLVTLDKVFPVGSIYQSTSGTSPASLFGGSWTQIKNAFLYASGSKSVGATGGEENHKLTTNEMPSHNHGSASLTGQGPEVYASKKVTCSGIVKETVTVEDREYTNNGGSSNRWITWSINATHTHTSNGGNAAHNNMPPYTVVNVWKRVS